MCWCNDSTLSSASISTSPPESCFARRFAIAATEVTSSLLYGAGRPGIQHARSRRHRDKTEEGRIAAPVFAVDAARQPVVGCVKALRPFVEYVDGTHHAVL
jgi:hypothetical protein